MKKKFNYEEKFMGLSAIDSESGAFKTGSKYEFRLWALIRSLKKTEGKILDVGCGAGGFINSLKFHYPRFKCFGCDISQTAIRFASKSSLPQIDFQVIKNNRLPYPSNYFDVVILIHVFEHVENKNELLKEIHRVLKKKGIFHLQMPCEANLLTFTRLKWGRNLTKKHWGHLEPMTDRQVMNFVRRHKFKILKKKYDSHFFSQLLLMVTYFLPKTLLDLFLGEKKALEYTDAKVKVKKRLNKDPLHYLRDFWSKLILWLTSAVRYLEYFIMNSVRFGALNLHLTSQKV